MMRQRKGFTLVELLVVIVILAVLIGLLVPALMRAVGTANDAAVTTEIQSIGTGLTAFHSQHGVYPPSRIVFAEDGDYSAKNLGDYAQLAPRSTLILRRLWPRIVFRMDEGKPSIPGGWYDFNGDHIKNEPYVMEGHECLAMFLGGVPVAGSNGYALSGFDKNPLNPFTSINPPPVGKSWPHGTNRTTPYFDFKGDRLDGTSNPTLLPLESHLVGYKDLYGGFYAYFSAYNGAGYDPDDVNWREEGQWLLGAFQSNNAATPVLNPDIERKDIVSSAGPNPYTNDSPIPVTPDGQYDKDFPRRVTYYNTNTYQLLSSGRDRLWGIGGNWDAKQSPTLPVYDGIATVTGQPIQKDSRLSERDNLTNFSKGGLD